MMFFVFLDTSESMTFPGSAPKLDELRLPALPPGGTRAALDVNRQEGGSAARTGRRQVGTRLA